MGKQTMKTTLAVDAMSLATHLCPARADSFTLKPAHIYN